jgi:ferredoxin
MTDQLPTIQVDRDLCMGSGVCTVLAPNTFQIDEETKATVIDGATDPSDLVLAAADACPMAAIALTQPRDASTQTPTTQTRGEQT